MISALKNATLVAVLCLFFAPWVHAADLNAEYLTGRWVLDAQDCSAADVETIEFHKNGTFESTRAGKAEAVGFWGINTDILELHMVTSPAYFDDIEPTLEAFKGLYQYFQARMAVYNIQKDSFEAVGVLGNQIERTRAVKCQ